MAYLDAECLCRVHFFNTLMHSSRLHDCRQAIKVGRNTRAVTAAARC